MILTSSDLLNLYDINSNKTTPFLSSNLNSTNTVAVYNHNKKIMAVGSMDGEVKFLDQRLGFIQEIKDSDVASSPITSLSFNHDSKLLAYAARNSFFKVYSLSNGQHIVNARIPNDFAVSILFSKDSSKLSICTSNGDIYTYLSPTYQTTKYKLQLQTKVNCMKYSPILDDIVGVTTDSGVVKVIDLAKAEIIANFEGEHVGTATCLAFSPISKIFLCSCGLDGKIIFFDSYKRCRVKTIETQHPLTTVVFNGRGDMVICGDANGAVLCYDIRNSERPKAVLLGSKGRINYIEINESTSISKMMSSNSNAEFSKTERVPLSEKNVNSNSNMAKSLPQQNSKKNAKAMSYNLTSPNISDNFGASNIGNINTLNNAQMKTDDVGSIGTPKSQQRTYNINSNVNQVMNQDENNIDPDIKNYIRECIENESNKLRQFIHEEVNTLHLDIIRQLQYQQNEIMNNMRDFSMLNQKMVEEVERLKKENETLKSQFF